MSQYLRIRKLLVSVFLIGSAFVVLAQLVSADYDKFWFADTSWPGSRAALPGGFSNDAGAGSVSIGSDGGVGVAAAAAEQRETTPNTRTLREIRIPAIGVKTSIQDLGLTADGRMGSPTNHYEAGWFKYGTKPGERGNAVIAGHVNTLRSPDGAFRDLHLLKAGDRVEITDRDGHTSVFAVTGVERIPYDSSPREVFGPTLKRRLNLITCAGAWIKERRTYTERLVVFTELVDN